MKSIVWNKTSRRQLSKEVTTYDRDEGEAWSEGIQKRKRKQVEKERQWARKVRG